MRVVLDTNVFVSGLFWEKGASGKIIDLWRKKKITLVTSKPIIEEIFSTLDDFKIQLREGLKKELFEELSKRSIVVHPVIKISIVRDKKDNKFLEAAVDGRAEFLITQDKDLLEIKEYKRANILTPEEFLKR